MTVNVNTTSLTCDMFPVRSHAEGNKALLPASREVREWLVMIGCPAVNFTFPSLWSDPAGDVKVTFTGSANDLAGVERELDNL